MEQINLPKSKPEVIKLARKLYREIINSHGRVDDKARTGISLSMYVPESRNGFIGKVRKPSDMAIILSVQKSTIAHERGYSSSLNYEDASKMLFGGSLTVSFDGYKIQCAISGLIGFEDTAMSAIIQGYTNKKTVNQVLGNVKSMGGKLPVEFFNPEHYIYRLLNKYDKVAFQKWHLNIC